MNDFSSVGALIEFRKGFSLAQQEILKRHRSLIEEEQARLKEEIAALEHVIRETRNFIELQLDWELGRLRQQLNGLPNKYVTILGTVAGFFKKSWLRAKPSYLKRYSKFKIWHSNWKRTSLLRQKLMRYQFILSDFNTAVAQSGAFELNELIRKKQVIDEITPIIYGALGEQKVVTELKKLSDDYVLINNFQCGFRPPINYKGKNF